PDGSGLPFTTKPERQKRLAKVPRLASTRIFLYGATSGDAAAFAVEDNIDLIGSGEDSAWEDFEVSFTATAGQAGESLVIGLGAGSNIANGAGGFNSNVAFDNVRLEAVPEPGSLALLALGGLFMSRRRRN
ncbi:MAG: PEP-CTERM sorting domain-containing protein, partial [Planctomycetota bacterium]